MSYDLILQTHADQDLSAQDFDSIQQALQQSTALQKLCETTLGQLAASPIEVIVLGEGLDFGDFSERDFTEFCSRRGLPADRLHQGAASAFVRSRFGHPVATFKLPGTDGEARTAYSEIIHFASRHGLRVIDPQKGADVDLHEPGLLPPKWGA